jgi:hypothetical protein
MIDDLFTFVNSYLLLISIHPSVPGLDLDFSLL